MKIYNFTFILSILFHVLVNFTLSKLLDYTETYQILTNTTFSHLNNASEVCGCDIKFDACDAYCCCDPLCNNYINGTRQWTFNEECWINPAKSPRFPKCAYNDKISSLSDLFSPMRVLSQNYKKGLCVSTDNSGLNNTLHDSNINLITTEQFDDYVNNQIMQKNITNVYPFKNDSIIINNLISVKDSNIKSFSYYNINDDIIYGFKSSSSSETSYSILKLPITNILGVCENNMDSVSFLVPKQISCGIKVKLEESSCLSFYSKILDSNLLNALVKSLGTNDSLNILNSMNKETSKIESTFNITTKIYQVQEKTYQYKINTNDISKTTSFSSFADLNLCLCNGIPKEVKLNFYMKNATINSLEISFYIENIEGRCQEEKYININYSYEFNNIDDYVDYKKSGEPGYLNNSPILSGKKDEVVIYNNVTNVNSTSSYIYQYKDSRKIFGISTTPISRIVVDTTTNLPTNFITTKTGLCYYSTDNDLQDESFIDLGYLGENFDFTIYKNPIFNNDLTFGNDLVWGCSENLSLQELKNLCINQIWKNKLIYDITKQLNFTGQFGNANRHFILDWIKSDDFNINSYQSIWDDLSNKCLIPSIIHIDIMYANYGLFNNTQNGILKVSRRLESTYWFGSTSNENGLYSITNNNNFQTYVRLNFIQVPLTTVWYFAPGPSPVFPKNIMYPFKVGQTQYWYAKQSSNNLKYSLFLILMLILLQA